MVLDTIEYFKTEKSVLPFLGFLKIFRKMFLKNSKTIEVAVKVC